ncbi:MAG: flagellar hook-associated protein FlgK [Deltaproteobacteria bacterium]|jgi:flagellar hook-associated protein 1 FlgK|nr:flagellar hook-associated protein FlgK [Deltaproteobacteria bacterium]
MASSINSILSIGNGALFASQAAIQTTGNNVANVDVQGYSRQYVRLETMSSLDYNPGQMGQGVKAAEVLRHFDKFIERSYLNKFSEQNRWTALSSQMRSVEAVFNESTGLGVGSALQEFYAAWEKLSQFPDDLAARENLIGKSQNLTQTLQTAGSTLGSIADRVDGMVEEQVNQANLLIKEIADLNRRINMHTVEGQNNANALLDRRDQLTRDLAALIDVDVIDKGEGNYIINTKAGHTLVDGVENFELYYGGGSAFITPGTSTVFTGQIGYSGRDGYEYTLEFVQGGTLGADDALFKVSLDGGRTWITDGSGQPELFTARESDNMVRVKNLDIYFEHGSNDAFTAGDRFTIIPKNTLYWIEPTMGPLPINPQVFPDGTENSKRISGGSIAGNLVFRDYNLNEINDQFTEFAKSIIWEVNRLHSQGSGLEPRYIMRGDYGVKHTNIPLNADNSGLYFKDELQPGNFVLGLFNADGNPIMTAPGTATALTVNFDPDTDSLEDLRDAINGHGNVTWVDAYGVQQTDPIGNFLEARIVDNRLEITGKNGYGFGLGNDTTGVLAALGLNTFFSGAGPTDITVRDEVVLNHNLINAGHMNGAGESNAGDAQTASQIAKLVDQKITFTNWTGVQSRQSISNYYGALVANVGGKTANSEFQETSATIIAGELADRQSEVSGVNLDEEMSNLIKFQASYKAAAKLITTADQMLQTLLSLKQ